MIQKNKKVVIGLSGGVDSSVAAFLLKEKGYEVIGMFMKNWSDENEDYEMCPWKKDRLDALRIATQLGIPFHTVDFEKEYREKVFDYMVREYQNAKTPNPDVLCNKEIKFELFRKKALELGADYIATGHYAIVKQKNVSDKKILFQLFKGVDPDKDQSYFLSLLNQEQLSYSLFPLGEYTKKEIREIAKRLGLTTASKKDSQGICFVGKVSMLDFLQKRIKSHEGDIVSSCGRMLGKHPGVEFFTIGQRKGIKLHGGPYYVVERNLDKNVLVVTNNKEDSRLYTQKIFGENIHWISSNTPSFPLKCKAKIRYRQNDQDVIVERNSDGNLICVFEKPQWAVSPGQIIVFYKDKECLGSCTIIE